MHELSVCLSLLEQVERIAAQHDAVSVEQIVLKLGPLSGIEADLLANAYPLAAAGTIAEDAKLVIEECGVRVSCSQCGAESDAAANRLVCGECGDFRTRVISGEEMILQRLEFSA